MTVDHADRARPPGVLTGPLRHDARGGGVPGLHVRWRDPSHDHGVPVDLPDHTAHELGGVGAVLEREVATCLVGQDEGARVRADAIRRDFDETGRLRLERQQDHQARRRHHAARREKPSTPNLHATVLPNPPVSIAGPICPSPSREARAVPAPIPPQG